MSLKRHNFGFLEKIVWGWLRTFWAAMILIVINKNDLAYDNAARNPINRQRLHAKDFSLVRGPNSSAGLGRSLTQRAAVEGILPAWPLSCLGTRLTHLGRPILVTDHSPAWFLSCFWFLSPGNKGIVSRVKGCIWPALFDLLFTFSKTRPVRDCSVTSERGKWSGAQVVSWKHRPAQSADGCPDQIPQTPFSNQCDWASGDNSNKMEKVKQMKLMWLDNWKHTTSCPNSHDHLSWRTWSSEKDACQAWQRDTWLWEGNKIEEIQNCRAALQNLDLDASSSVSA